jgi:photosystem II stability/assembly factor-like uncharacterized protein
LSWERLKGGLPEGIAGRPGIAISTANPERLWVIQETMDESKGGIFRSDNGGSSWKKINREHNLRQRAWYYSHIYAHPQDENTVYVLNTRFYRSIDGGKNFERINTPHGDDHDLWINPEHPNVMIESNDGGANISFNGGKTWTTQLNQPTAEMYRVAVDNQFPYRVYGAQQDNSTISVPSRTEGGITAKENWYAVGGGESGHIAVHPENPDIIFAGNYIGQITHLSRDQSHERNVVAYPQMHDGTAPRDIKYRFQWNAPIRISPHDPSILYHCSQYVHRSKDQGQSWEVISPDLTTDNDSWQDIPGGPVQHDHTGVELYTTIFAFEESPHEAGVLWAGSDDGLLYISKDHGENWIDITPPMLPKNATINMIDLSTHGKGRALIAAYKYRENDFRPMLFLTDNYGEKWISLTQGKNGIPHNHFTRVVREDPARKGLLYAGTEYGMYISFDEGINWLPFQLNLPVTPVTDMLIKNKDLVIATQGRSFWIMDDLSPLHTWDRESPDNVHIFFEPSIAFRSQLGQPSGDHTPETPPDGVVFYFYLGESYEDGDTISLSIVDERNQYSVIYSTHPDTNKGELKLEAQKGLNRFIWNMRFKAPKVEEGSVFSLARIRGPKAPPGEYKSILYAGQQFGQSFRIMKDPRWECTDSDLQDQYKLTWRCHKLLENIHNDIGELRNLREQLKTLSQRKDIKNLDLSISINDILEKIDKQEKLLIQTKSESGQDPINYPSMIDDQVAYLYSVVNGQDGKPTMGCYQRFDDLEIDYRIKRKPYVEIINNINQLNQALIEKGVSIISQKVVRP